MNASLPLNALIVDDERLARKELLYLLRDFSDIKAIGEADNVRRAAHLIDEKHPDVVFLDVHMRGESGFDLLDLVDASFRVVFVTGYDEYAIRAFEVNALDYLLKPVRFDRLAEAIRRLVESTPRAGRGPKSADRKDVFFLRFGKQSRFVNLHDIIYISAAGDYSEVITGGGQRALVSSSLKDWEKKLPLDQFVRTHRSTIVNLEYVEDVTPTTNNAFLVYMQGQPEPLRMSRRYASKIKLSYTRLGNDRATPSAAALDWSYEKH